MKKLAISSGHGLKVSGAIGLVNEVKEARILTNLVKVEFNRIYKGIAKCVVFHDDVSTTQNVNLLAINNWHSKQKADLDVSFHLNSSGATTAKDIGVEVLYKHPENYKSATKLSFDISNRTKLKDRGAKKRDNLYILNGSVELLVEAYFVNSRKDVSLMDEDHEKVSFANAVAMSLGETMGLKPISEKYRFKSGSFKDYVSMEKAVSKAHELSLINVKWVQLTISEGRYYFRSGVYENKQQAEKIVEQLIKHKIISKAHYLKV